MDLFAYGKTLADLWSTGARAMTGDPAALRAYAERLTGAMTPAAGMKLPGLDGGELARTGQSIMDLWTSATNLSTSLAARLQTRKADDSVTAATLEKMMDPSSWLSGFGNIDQLFQGVAEGPRFADLWNVERRYFRVMQAWLGFQRASLEHSAVVLRAWIRVGQSFSEALAKHAGRPPPSSKELLALWTEIANGILLETQHSDDYQKTQAGLVRASTEVRSAQQEMTEHLAVLLDLPTRTELDDVYRAVTELRREVRAARRQTRQAPPAAIPAPTPKPARKAPAPAPAEG